MPLGTEVDLGPGNIVLGGVPAPPPEKGGTAAPHLSAHVLWPNGWMDQDATWYGGRARPRRHCIRWGPSSFPKGAQTQIFGPCLLWPNGWMDHHATWYGGRPRPRPHCVTWGPNSPTPERGTAALLFSAHVYCGQTVAHLSATAELWLPAALRAAQRAGI